MKRLICLVAFLLPLTGPLGCREKSASSGYKVYFKARRQNTQPAVGFKVDASIKGKSQQPETKITGADGMANFDDLPTPDRQHQLVTVLHYYAGQKDQSREITYPYIDSDAARLKDTQYIPNTVTPDPQ